MRRIKMKISINKALYCFLGQWEALNQHNHKLFSHMNIHYGALRNALEGITSSIIHGTNIVISNPEVVALPLKNRISENGFSYRGPMLFSYKSLCLWYMPNVLSSDGMVKERHLLCIQRINEKAIYINYAISEDEEERIQEGYGNLNWIVIPAGLLFVFPPYDLVETPILPLPEILNQNIRLKKSILDIKGDINGEKTSMKMVSLLRTPSSEDDQGSQFYFIPGFFEVFCGFLTHLMGKTLYQKSMVEPGLYDLPEIKYMDVEFKKKRSK